MKKVFKFVKGKKDERKEGGGITPSQSGDLVSPARTPEDEAFLGLDNSCGYDVDFAGKDKTLTKLHKAAWQGNLEKLKSALKKVEVDAVDRRNRTALHFAVARGHPNIVWFLLGSNADTSVADDDGHTPLLKAIECGHKDCTKLLLDRGADVNACDYTGNAGLHVAVDRASLSTASALLEKGADTEIGNNAGDYPLHIATRLENKELVDLLLDAGASVDVTDRENRTPLMLAAKTGNCILARSFVERGAQLTVVDSNGWTAQDYAMLGGHENVSAWLKSIAKNAEKKLGSRDERDREPKGDSGPKENGQKEVGEEEPITQKLKKLFEKCSEEEASSGEKEKPEELPESPDAEVIPPFCQPPRSWEMIQAGMIDENKNKIEPKRRSITTLGTLHSRRESFTESSAPSPQFTLSLNRRKGSKGTNSFAKQRFSFNEEESLRRRTLEERTKPKERAEDAGGEGESGTLGRAGTMRGVEEIWVACPRTSPSGGAGGGGRNGCDSEDASSEKEGSFPPPPSALELGIDMARSIKFAKGMSVDRPPGCVEERNLWKSARERRSLDCLEERDFVEVLKGSGPKTQSQERENLSKCQKPADRFADVNRRINQELECYDQALRELAESSTAKTPHNYHSLPSIKSGGGGECRRTNSQEFTSDASSRRLGGPHSLPLFPDGRAPVTAEASNPSEETVPESSGEKLEKKTKRHMLLAMRDVKHAVHVASTFKTSMDDQILSPLAKPESGFDSNDETSPKGVPRSSEDGSPLDENPFFGIGRQETVLERNGTRRKSSSSGTGEESTLWLQEDSRPAKGLPCPDSDEEVSEMGAEERWKHRRESSFSPLGLIHKEMEEESRGAAPEPRRQGLDDRIRGDNEERNEEILREQSPDVSLSSGPIEPIGAEKDSGSEPESSHNDASPTHNYAFQSQHEWLKSHLKAATSEKNKLEELTARLSEKAERLQYELADAREAAKSRDEVIRLLQGQLARMEAAYTKSLEESVQNRLQLTSHEQEILHLKELCFRYEEEKEVAEAGAGSAGSDVPPELKQKIKALEVEKERMREEIGRLEEEKALLEKRLKQGRREEAEMLEECQRWKERCRHLEETGKTKESRGVVCESCAAEKTRESPQQENPFFQRNVQLEKQLVDLQDESVHLKEKIQRLTTDLEVERKRAGETEQKEHFVSEIKQKTFEMEIRLKKLEKELEESVVKRLKEKEEEAEKLVKSFTRERESLMASYEQGLREGRTGGTCGTCPTSKPSLATSARMVPESPCHLEKDLNAGEFSRAVAESEIFELRTEVSALRRLLEGGGQPSTTGSADRASERQSGRVGRRRTVGKEDGSEWSSLYGMRATRRRRSERSVSVTEAPAKKRDAERTSPEDANETEKPKQSSENPLRRDGASETQEPEPGGKSQKLQFLELKKEILFLQSRMQDEKYMRHALENEMLKINRDLSEKEKLEKEVDSLKRKAERDHSRRFEMELLEQQSALEAKREKYLGGKEGEAADESYRAKCEALAKERERSKQTRSSLARKTRSFEGPPPEDPLPLKFHSRPRPLPELRFVALDPEVKDNLERKLDKSIRKYIPDASSKSTMPTVQLEIVRKSVFNECK